MPLGFERLNERQIRPNSLINFIKPLEGPDKAIALDFLNRIAAISYPIMAKNNIAVMSLEEYEPNKEFVGRNFNAGEVIQLVLKAPFSGHWLPFRHVQMVMMHELAHCKQMNHSGAFWKVRNSYADELRILWNRNYVGEGLWGRGRMLADGELYTTANLNNETLPASLCGGTYRSNRRKRKRGDQLGKPQLSYAERQQRRIARKFGKGGTALGEDSQVKAELENGKKVKGKPRVANSARGRELRAAAALARFEVAKETVPSEPDSTDSESDYEDYDLKTDALDINGTRLLDLHGHGMIKICEDEDLTDIQVKQEMDELREATWSLPSIKSKSKPDRGQSKSRPKPGKTSSTIKSSSDLQVGAPKDARKEEKIDCPICSCTNEASALMCLACAHVLNSALVPGAWKCRSEVCKDSAYINNADYGVCGVCGQRKTTAK